MTRVALALGILAVWACGPIDQSGGTASGGSPDGGTTADGGAAGGGGSGGVDAGTGGGGGSPGAALDCGGILPGDLGTAVTVTTPHADGEVCWDVTGDVAGNIAAESHPGSSGEAFTGRWQVWSTTGAARGSFRAG